MRIREFLERNGIRIVDVNDREAGAGNANRSVVVLTGEIYLENLRDEHPPKDGFKVTLRLSLQEGTKRPHSIVEIIGVFDQDDKTNELRDLLARLIGLPLPKPEGAEVPMLQLVEAEIDDPTNPYHLDPDGWLSLKSNPNPAMRPVKVAGDGISQPPIPIDMNGKVPTFDLNVGDQVAIELRNTDSREYVVELEIDGIGVTAFSKLKGVQYFLIPPNADAPTVRKIPGWLIDNETTRGFQVVHRDAAAGTELRRLAEFLANSNATRHVISLHTHVSEQATPGTPPKGTADDMLVIDDYEIGRGKAIPVKTTTHLRRVGGRQLSLNLRYRVVKPDVPRAR